MKPAQRWALIAGASLVASSALAAPNDHVVIFSAGSLRGVVADLASDVRAAYGIEVKPTFGGSGMLRERIEKGEAVDLFLSADVASPRKLEMQGRAVVPAIPFARNRMCILSHKSLGLNASNLIERLLEKNVKLKTSTPVADPGGDYAWAIFDRIDAQRPGTGDLLKAKAQASMSLPAEQADARITYCSATATLEKETPELTDFVVSGPLDPHPMDGMVVLTNREASLRVALYLLSDKGQAIIERERLVPLAEHPATPP